MKLHLLLLALWSTTAGAAEVQHPNILLILIDDMGWMDLGCQGSSFYETPVIDQLASEGLRFTDAYAACQVCSPSRAAILTGRSPAAVGITNYIPGERKAMLLPAPYKYALDAAEITLPEVLRDHGYRTVHLGKWHLGGTGSLPTDHGYERNIGGGEWGHPPKGYFAPFGLPNLPDQPGTYLTDVLTDAAIANVNDPDPRPFFVSLCQYGVHTPMQATAELVKKYQQKAARLGLDPRPLTAGDIIPGERNPEHRLQYRTLQSHAVYAAMIENLDTNIGRLLAALQASGRAKDTLVIFTSDNGGLATAEGSPTSNLPLRFGKGWMEEGGIRVPFIIRWPGHVRPGICQAPVIGTDLMPTLVAAAGAPEVPGREGVNLMPLLAGAQAMPERALCWHYPHYANQGGRPACAIRSGDWKLITWFEDQHTELYDVRHDPGETHDLSAKHPELIATLTSELTAWQERVGAKMPTPNPAWTPVKP